MGTGLPTKVMLGQTLILMQITFLNYERKVGRLVLSRTTFFQFVLATGPKVGGFKPGRGRWVFKGDKNP
jgi:hypothetical protein